MIYEININTLKDFRNISVKVLSHFKTPLGKSETKKK